MKRAEIENLLPEIIRRTVSGVEDNPLDIFLDLMEWFHQDDEEVLASLDSYFDVYRAPDIFVNFLAGWLDLDDLWIDSPEDFNAKTLPGFPSGAGNLRNLASMAAFLSRWHGTWFGLRSFLEIGTGITGFTIDEHPVDKSGQPHLFHIVVHAPHAAADLRPLIDRIIQKEKPAYITYELMVEEG